MSVDVEGAFGEHRAALLGHCYRMMGSFAEAEDLVQDTLERAWKARVEYRGDAPVGRWLHAIATNACLNALSQRKRRALPALERPPAASGAALEETEPERWITPAPDQCLFPDPEAGAARRETVALAFVALLQRVPPRQRAALLLKDVLGWSAEEIATTLELSIAAVHSALHRARAAVTRETPPADDPPPEVVGAFVRAWETRDLDALVTLLTDDVTLSMPPYATWFQGADVVMSFFASPQFAAAWSRFAHVTHTRANGLPAFAFFREVDGRRIPHALLVARFRGGTVATIAEMTVFIGATNFAGFEDSLPQTE